LPIKAITRLSGRAKARAASAEVAAVRKAVPSVSSLSSNGKPLDTSASTPKAITVGRPERVFLGWPLTYLKLYWLASAIGISSITPSLEWLATRADLANMFQRRKSCSMQSVRPCKLLARPWRWISVATSCGLRNRVGWV